MIARALSGAGTIASRAFVGSSRRFAAVSRVVLASRTCFGAGIGRFSARYKRTARAVRGRSSSISKRPLDRRAIRAVERAVRVRSQGPHAASARARGPADGRVDGAGGCWSARSTIGRLEPTRDRTYAGSRCALEAHLDAPILGLKRSDGRRTMVQWTPKRLIRGRQSAVHCDLNAPQETMRVIGRLQRWRNHRRVGPTTREISDVDRVVVRRRLASAFHFTVQIAAGETAAPRSLTL